MNLSPQIPWLVFLFSRFCFAASSEVFLEKLTSAFSAQEDSNYFRRIMDVCLESKNSTFEMTPASALELLDVSRKIARKCAQSSRKVPSLDHQLLLAYLEYLAHRAAQIYDQSLSGSKRLNFEDYRMSQALKEAIFAEESPQRSFFNYPYIDLLKRIFPVALDDTVKIPFGPERFCKTDVKEFVLFGRAAWKPDTVTKRILQIYDHKLFNYIEKIKADGSLSKEVRAIWIKMDPALANLLVVMTVGQDDLYTEIPHYYLYMDTLQSVRMAISMRPVRFINERPFWTFSNDPANPDRITVNAQPSENNKLFLHPSKITIHSHLSFDSWFNYIKSARTAVIFDSIAFQYTSDHLLNVPKFKKGRLAADPVDFVFNRCFEVITELTRLIEASLNDLDNCDKETSQILVMRVANLSILTSRFISRCIYTLKSSASDNTNDLQHDHPLYSMLLNLYNLILPFSNSDSLPVAEISRLHLALCHISVVKGDMSLESLHCVVAQEDYESSGGGLADDQFDFGIKNYLEDNDNNDNDENVYKFDSKSWNFPTVYRSNLSKKHKLELFTTDPSLENVAYINFSSLYRNKFKNVLLTDGLNVAVSLDLVSKYPPGRPFRYNLEGSHLLVGRKENAFKVILISSAFAERIKQKYLNDSMWLCDLSGHIITGISPISTTTNIIDILGPEAIESIFDALIFNGSLTHILAAPKLNELYHGKWIKDDFRKDRAEFLLQRMKWKKKLMFKFVDEDYERLKRIAEIEESDGEPEHEDTSDQNQNQNLINNEEEKEEEEVNIIEERENEEEEVTVNVSDDNETIVSEPELEVDGADNSELGVDFGTDNVKSTSYKKLIALSIAVFCLIYVIIHTTYSNYHCYNEEYHAEESDEEEEESANVPVEREEQRGEDGLTLLNESES